MENNNYNSPFSADNAEEPVHIEVLDVSTEVESNEATDAANAAQDAAEAAVEAVVEAPAVVEPVQALGFTETGAIGSMAADGPSKTINTDVDLSEKVALHSTKSVRWEEVGSLTKGYNIVTKAQANKWLTRGHVRIASPEEVQKAFG
jgi:hypothetical protein